MKSAAIIGFGRFGELLAKLCSPAFDVTIIENDPARAQAAKRQGYSVVPFNTASKSDLIFLAVPISKLEPTLFKLAPLVSKNHVVIDLCSVKVYPVALMQKHLPTAQIVGTHPMFGPDSAKQGLKDQQVAICPLRVAPENLKLLTEFWSAQGTEVIETTPDQHDKDAAYSQAFTYSLAKIILNMNLPEITFKTRSFNALTEIARLSANDSQQLFHDILFYNPYFPEMKAELEAAITKTQNELAKIEAEQVKTR